MADISAESAPKPARDVQIMVRMTEQGTNILDKLRGDQSRQDYLRGLVAKEYQKARKAGRIR